MLDGALSAVAVRAIGVWGLSYSVWNSLPSRVVEAGSVECFKRRLDVVLGSKLLETI